MQLLRILTECKRQGMTFGQAWVVATRPGKAVVMSTTAAAPVLAIRWPTDRFDREQWQRAILGSREAWRRAYYGAPPSASEQALMVLGGLLDSLGALSLDEGMGDESRLLSVA